MMDIPDWRFDEEVEDSLPHLSPLLPLSLICCRELYRSSYGVGLFEVSLNELILHDSGLLYCNYVRIPDLSDYGVSSTFILPFPIIAYPEFTNMGIMGYLSIIGVPIYHALEPELPIFFFLHYRV